MTIISLFYNTIKAANLIYNWLQTSWPAPCFIGSGCPKRDFPESGCPFMEGYILYNMIKQDAVGVWTARTPPVALPLNI